MTLSTSCPHETDVLDLVAIGQWPSRADAALKEHVATCDICADLASVALAMTELGDASSVAAHVPSAAVVWYRAQVAAREELARKVARPMILAEVAAVIGVLGGVLAAWRVLGVWIGDWWRGASLALPTVDVTSWMGPLSTWRWVALALLAWTALIPAAFYLAHFVDRAGDPHPDRRGRS